MCDHGGAGVCTWAASPQSGRKSLSRDGAGILPPSTGPVIRNLTFQIALGVLRSFDLGKALEEGALTAVSGKQNLWATQPSVSSASCSGVGLSRAESGSWAQPQKLRLTMSAKLPEAFLWSVKKTSELCIRTGQLWSRTAPPER